MGGKWPKRMLEMKKWPLDTILNLTNLSHLPTPAHQDPYSGPLGQHLYQISALHSKKKRTFISRVVLQLGWATMYVTRPVGAIPSSAARDKNFARLVGCCAFTTRP